MKQEPYYIYINKDLFELPYYEKNRKIKIPKFILCGGSWNGIIYGSEHNNTLCFYISSKKFELTRLQAKKLLEFRLQVIEHEKTIIESQKCVDDYEKYLDIKPLT